MALLSQGVSFLAMATASFLIPKILNVSEFGYWQLFLLYAGYVGLAHLGLNDGVYLKHGGEDRKNIDKGLVKGQFIVEAIWQLAISLMVFLFVLSTVQSFARSFVLAATAVILVLSNLTNFMGYVFQAMNETKKYSISILVNRCSYFALIVFLIAFRIDRFELFIAAYIVAQLVAFVFCLGNFTDFFKANTVCLKDVATGVFCDIRIGAKLMLANLASSFILGSAKFVIEGNWGIDVFSMISFSITLATFFLSFVNQIAMVLFPALRKEDNNDLFNHYMSIKQLIDPLLPLIYVFYAPIALFVAWWLPAYSESLSILPLLLPICVYDSKMSLLSTTFFKVTRRENVLLLVNVVACLISIAGACVGVLLFDSPHVVVLGSVLAIVVRSLISEQYFASKFHAPVLRSMVFDATLTTAFLYIALSLELPFVSLCTLFLYLAFVLCDANHRKGVLRLLSIVYRSPRERLSK